MTIYQSDILEYLKNYSGDPYHAVFGDPPYALPGGFMSKNWDHFSSPQRYQAWVTEWATALLDVVYPGAVLALFGGTRTYHRLASGLEDAGWDVFDCVMYMYGSGFPKSLSIGRAIDKERNDEIRPVCRFLRAAIDKQSLSVREIAAHFGFHPRMVEHWAARDTDSQPTVPTWDQWKRLKGLLVFGDEMDAEVKRLNERKGEPGDDWKGATVIGEYERDPGGFGEHRFGVRDTLMRAPATPAAVRWSGYGTSLKPSYEPLILARSPNPPLLLTDMGVKIVTDHVTALLEATQCLRLLSTVSIAESNSKSSPPNLNAAVENTVAAPASEPHSDGENGAPVLSAEPSSMLLGQASNSAMASSVANNVRTRLADWRVRLTQTGEADDLHALMGMLPSEMVPLIDSNTMSLWKSSLVGLLNQMNKFTIEMASEMITDLRTLNWLLSQVISESITPQSATRESGRRSSVLTAANALSVAAQKWSDIPTLSAHAAVSSKASGADFVPDFQPVILARAPRAGLTYAECATQFGSSALNIDGCRLEPTGQNLRRVNNVSIGGKGVYGGGTQTGEMGSWEGRRWPANTCLDEDAAALLDEQSGIGGTGVYKPRSNNRTAVQFSPDNGWHNHHMNPNQSNAPDDYGDRGGASRFFYTSKASTFERMIPGPDGWVRTDHPTLKPLKLCSWLSTLLAPPKLDQPRRLLIPFSGVGSEMIGAHLSGMWEVVDGVEMDENYVRQAEMRLSWWKQFSTYEEAKKAYQHKENKPAVLELY